MSRRKGKLMWAGIGAHCLFDIFDMFVNKKKNHRRSEAAQLQLRYLNNIYLPMCTYSTRSMDKSH